MAKIPAWKLPGSDGTTYASKDLKGTPYVLYFYPRDNTPGCTTEACDFRDNMARVEGKGVKVFGVSPDTLKSHDKFITKFDLPFVLLADEDHAIAEKLGVWGLKKFMGRESMGIIRTTFLISADGTILKQWDKVKVKGHVDEVLAAIDELV
jgi:peroxiredoxin Q/BCP